MKIFYSDAHLQHHPKAELHRGQMIDPHEGPHRMDLLLKGMRRAGFKDFETPSAFDESRLLGVHSPAYVDFLKTAWQRWAAAGYAGDVLPMSYPHRPRRAAPPADIDGAAGYFCSSSDTVVTETSWQALCGIAACALSAADSVSRGKDRASFALIRPPGHHAGPGYMAGYCLLNNSAIAVQALRDNGAERVAVLDVDFHHGNGTQDIFYDRNDVFFASLHGDPDHHFPYFWGHADETGEGAGLGFTANYPLPAGTPYQLWAEALETAIANISTFGAEALVISLGVDTFEHDPISSFKLKTTNYPDYGRRIARMGLPTVFIMEGGYGVEEIGDNVAGVLRGFLNG